MLDAVVNGFADEAVGLPERRYVSEGNTSWDCEQLTVRFVRSTPGLPGAGRVDPMGQRCAQPRSAEYEVQLIRCAAAIEGKQTAPTPAAIEANAAVVLTDAWLLPIAIALAASAGEIAGGCQNIVVGALTARGPEGGFVGNQLTVEIGVA